MSVFSNSVPSTIRALFLSRVSIAINLAGQMAFKISLLALLTAILYFSSQSRVTLGKELTQKSQASTHGEVYRAKSQIDSLIYKLTLDLNTFNEKEKLATVMQKDAKKLAQIAEEEIALLKPIQHLLDKLIKGNASSGNQRCLIKGGKFSMRIEIKGSTLPKYYTISVPGKNVCSYLIFLVLATICCFKCKNELIRMINQFGSVNSLRKRTRQVRQTS